MLRIEKYRQVFSQSYMKNGGTIMPRKGQNIYKRKDGRWEGRYIKYYDENKKAKYGYIYGKTYHEVKRKLLDKKINICESVIVVSKERILYDRILTDWLQFVKINIKESTYARYVHLVERHIRPNLGKYELSQISTQLIEGFIEQKLKEGRLDKQGCLSSKTVIDIVTIIKSSMEYAKYNHLPVTCNLHRVTIKKKEKEMRVLCLSEQEALVKVLLNNTDLYKFGVLLSLYTGIRIGELCALKWENLSIEYSILKVRETMQRIQDTNVGAISKTKIVITEPKSQCSIRDIPLPDFLIEIAKPFSNHPKSFVLSGDKIKYIEPRTMQNHFKTYVEESGCQNVNFHSLRHTFATRCVEAGFELKSLSEILGHANTNITLNRYVHSSFELKYANMNKLSLPI